MKHNHKFLIILALITTGVLFYWFQYRPSEIRKSCTDYAEKIANRNVDLGPEIDWKEEYDTQYKLCLRGRGLE